MQQCARSGVICVTIFGLLLPAKAASILGFAVVGGTSHQASVAHIGLELLKRGHNFTLLISSADTISQARLARAPFSSIQQLRWSGPSWIGTDAWLRSLPRDPQEVRKPLRHTLLQDRGSLLCTSNVVEKYLFAGFRYFILDTLISDHGRIHNLLV